MGEFTVSHKKSNVMDDDCFYPAKFPGDLGIFAEVHCKEEAADNELGLGPSFWG